MLRNINHKWAVIAVSSILLLNGCSTTSIMQTKRETAKNVKYASDISKEMQNPNASNVISFSDTPFLSTKTFSQNEVIKPLPPVFSKKLSINTHQKKTLPAYIQTIVSMTGLCIKLTQDAQDELNGLSDNGANKKNASRQSASSNRQGMGNLTSGEQQNNPQKDKLSTQKKQNAPKSMRIDYSGTLQSFLDHLTSDFGLYWRYDYERGQIVIFKTQTETFKLSVIPTEINNTTTISSSDSNNPSKVEYKTEKVDAFEAAVSDIENLGNLSLSSNKTFSMVTVTATPPVLVKVKDYIDNFNHQATQRVEVKISIYNVQVNRDSNYGINWNLIYKSTQGMLNWSTSGMGSALSNSISTATFTGGLTSGVWAGSNIIASAIQKYLDASYITSYNFYSLNGQSTPINNGSNDGYVKNLSVTTLGSESVVSSNNVSTSVEQGTIQSGFIGNVVTSVLNNNQILIRLSLSRSELKQLEQIQYGNKDNPSIIQIPHTEQSKFIQNIMIKSGQTAVITGFTNDKNQVGTNSLGDRDYWKLGGSEATQGTKNMMVVIVSAYLIGGHWCYRVKYVNILYFNTQDYKMDYFKMKAG